MNNLFSIGETSKIKDITIKALRYYHKMNILIPKYIDKETGYRYYSIDQFIYIDIIKGCRALGTSIMDLKDIFKERDTDKLMEFLNVKRLEAEKTINKMKEIIQNIDELNKSVNYSKKLSNNKEINKQFYEKRCSAVVPCGKLGDLNELIYYSDLQKIIEEKKLSTTIERGIMYNCDSKGKLSNIFVFNMLEDNKLKGSDYIKIIPKGMYLTINYKKEDEIEQLEKLRDYIKENKLNVKTFIEVDLLNDFFNTESYSCQVQAYIE